MSIYHNVVYKNYPKSNFSRKLVWKLIWDYMKEARRCNVPPRAKILDVGCGTGEIVGIFNDYGFTSIGIDKDIVMLSNGKPRKLRKGLDLNKDKFPCLDNSFDYVFTKSTIEHIQNTEHFLSECKRVLKPNGKIIILTPSWEYNWHDFYNDYTHIKPFHRKGLQDALKINGFNNVNVDYFYYLPWLWGRPYLLPVAKILSLFARWKWKNREENIHRVNIRFAQEVQLLGVAIK